MFSLAVERLYACRGLTIVLISADNQVTVHRTELSYYVKTLHVFWHCMRSQWGHCSWRIACCIKRRHNVSCTGYGRCSLIIADGICEAFRKAHLVLWTFRSLRFFRRVLGNVERKGRTSRGSSEPFSRLHKSDRVESRRTGLIRCSVHTINESLWRNCERRVEAYFFLCLTHFSTCNCWCCDLYRSSYSFQGHPFGAFDPFDHIFASAFFHVVNL